MNSIDRLAPTVAQLLDPSTKFPGDFLGPELAQTPQRYVVELCDTEKAALRSAAEAIVRAGPSREIEARVHEALSEVTTKSKRMLTAADGVVLLRGIPTRGFERETLASLFTYVGTALGEPAAQNLEGDLLTDIRDIGADPNDPDVRLYRTRAEQDFHTDGADIIGLLCLHPAASGGLSRIVSSVRVLRRVAERHPNLAPLLFEPWWFHLPGGAARGLPPAVARPIATWDGGKLESFFIGWYIRNAQGLDGVPELDEARRQVLVEYEATANDPALYLDMELRPGDVQWLRNAFVLHKRTEYVDPEPPLPKRHLLRLWLNAHYLGDSTPRFDRAEARI